MPPTPWASKVSGRPPTGTLPSDRLRAPRAQPASRPNSSGGGSGSKVSSGRGTPEPPRSDAVKRLEGLLEGVRGKNAGTRPDPRGGCFCQARVHELSSYTPLCTTCGLILCNLNPPQNTCPSCSSPLFTPSAHPTLISRLETELAAQISRESEDREAAIAEAKRVAGSFPTLGAQAPGFATGLGVAQLSPGSADSGLRATGSEVAAPKVLSLTGKGRATIGTLQAGKNRTPDPSRPSTPAAAAIEAARKAEQQKRAEEREMGSRIAAPPPEVVCASRKPDPARPWEDVRGERRMYYIPLPSAESVGRDVSQEHSQGKRKPKHKEQGHKDGEEKSQAQSGGTQKQGKKRKGKEKEKAPTESSVT